MSLAGVRLGRCVLCGAPCDKTGKLQRGFTRSWPLCHAHSDLGVDAVPPDPLTSLPMQDDEAWDRENRRVLGL